MNDYPKSKDLHQGSNHVPPPPPPQTNNKKQPNLPTAGPPNAGPPNANPPNTTLYGEMVPTSFMWLSPDKQRQRAAELENNTKPKSP